jgi:hypothetical protein
MTYLEAVAKLLRRERGRWVDGLTIAKTGGAYSWRTRISECRTLLGMKVENRQRKVGRRVVSEYRVTR